MKREDALVALRRLEPSLRSQGLAHLYLFGSVARNIDQSRVMRQISEALCASVDLVESDYLRPRIAKSAAAEMVQVF